MGQKKELTLEEKINMAIKYEIAEELGLTDKVWEVGWKGLTAKETGKIGGIMGKRKKNAEIKKQEREKNLQ